MFCTLKKKLGPDRMHPEVLKELADTFPRLLSIIFERAWRLEEVPSNWGKTNVTPSFQKGKKDDLRNNRQVSFTSVAKKFIEQVLLEAISRHTKEKPGTRNSQPLSRVFFLKKA